MSDRFVLHAPQETVESLFGVTSTRTDYFEPNYNIAPGALHPVIMGSEDGPALVQAKWGLLPPDAAEERAGVKNTACAAESLLDDKWTAECANQRRCLVPANGFYKWKSSAREQTPFYIRLMANRLTAFAGVYSEWESANGRTVYSFAVITTQANTLVEPVDDRMPVLLQPDDFDAWLAEGPCDEALQELLQPYPLTEMAVNRVSEAVNDTDNNGAELIQPIPK